MSDDAVEFFLSIMVWCHDEDEMEELIEAIRAVG
jgi:hypothetical protein